jgi:hypothetical protein
VLTERRACPEHDPHLPPSPTKASVEHRQARCGGLDAQGGMIAVAHMELILRRPNVSRKRGHWQHEDYDVFDGNHDIGRIYLVDSYGSREIWFWGVSFQLTGKKSCGHAPSLEAAKAVFKAEYERWQRERR